MWCKTTRSDHNTLAFPSIINCLVICSSVYFFCLITSFTNLWTAFIYSCLLKKLYLGRSTASNCADNCLLTFLLTVFSGYELSPVGSTVITWYNWLEITNLFSAAGMYSSPLDLTGFCHVSSPRSLNKSAITILVTSLHQINKNTTLTCTE